MLAILMATYNGSTYIKDQIDSILTQTYKDWILYIHDDGSTDNTLSLVKKYTAMYPNKIVLLDDSVKHRGPTKSFMWLLEHVEADYYMFADQDDVWLDFKIEMSVEMLQASECNNQPTLCFSDLMVVDKDCNIIAKSMWEYTKMNVYINAYSTLYASSVTGCTMILNNNAKQVSLRYKDLDGVHDTIISLALIANKGKLVPIYIPTIKYRQHGNNVLGIKEYDNSMLSRISDIRRIIKVNFNHYKLTHKIGGISFFAFVVLQFSKKILLKYATKKEGFCYHSKLQHE